MNFVNFVLNDTVSTPVNPSIRLFRISATNLQNTGENTFFNAIYQYKDSFSLHVILDGSIRDEEKALLLVEKIFLIIGKDNYYTAIKNKILFLSFPDKNDDISKKIISTLRSHSYTIEILLIQPLGPGQFKSSINICLEDSTEKQIRHFQAYVTHLTQNNLLFEYNFNYFLVSAQPIEAALLNRIVAEELGKKTNLISLLNDSATAFAQQKECIDSTNKEVYALLNALSFLKSEVRNQHREKVGVHESLRWSEHLAVSSISNRVEEIKRKYHHEYEEWPILYKKIGAMLKVLSGRKEMSYYLNKRQKENFLKLLQSLPRDKQVEMWYYYEYEILPKWYKKLARFISKKTNAKSF